MTPQEIIRWNGTLRSLAKDLGCSSWMEVRIITLLGDAPKGDYTMEIIGREMGLINTPMYPAVKKTVFSSKSKGVITQIGDKYKLSPAGVELYKKILVYLPRLSISIK